MIVYGRNAVREALRGPRAVRAMWASERVAREPWLREGRGKGERVSRGPAEGEVGVEVVAGEELEARCGSATHQGVCAEVEPYRYADPDALLSAPDPLIVALDEVTDPQNLGAVCRTAEAAGATGVVVPRRRSAEVTPAVCKASAGAVEHLALARVRNLADFLADAKRAGCWCYGAGAGARVPYDRPDYAGGVVVVLGSEGRGLRPRVAGACDELVAIPQRGRVGSLNVAAATAVLVYEILQRRAGGLDRTP